MTLFEQIAQSPEALAKWWGGMVDCAGCPFTDECPSPLDCELVVRKKLNEEVK